jgi:hypothetical protein
MGIETTFAGLIAAPESEKVFLCEIRPGESVTDFSLTTAQTYTYELSYLNETVTLADASTETIRKSVVACELDGTALTAKTSIATVEGTAGTYWHDTDNALLYIHPPDDGSPNHHTVIVYFWVYYATKGIVLDSKYYEPYIAENGIPSISQERQAIFWGTSKISAGTVVLLNGRGYFDQISKRWLWNSQQIKILLGGDSLAYAEYTTLFAGKIIGLSFTETEISLEITSKSFDLLRTLPINSYWTSNYPNLDPTAEGRAMPYYWGSYNIDQAPIVTCINIAYGVNVFQFQICDTTYHEIKSITGVYVDYGSGSGWEFISHGNESLANATFTISTELFIPGTSQVKVSFEGYHSGGTLIEGAPEIVEDILLNQCGYVGGDLNAASFAASKTESTCQLNVPVEAEQSALTIIETICQSDFAFFGEDADGLLRYTTWDPLAAGAVPDLTKEDILELPEIIEDVSNLYVKINVGYSYMCNKDDYLYTETENDEAKYLYKRNDSLTVTSYLRTKIDADTLAGRLSWIMRNPSTVISLKLKAGQINKLMGDKFSITLARTPYATVGGYSAYEYEIMAKEISCFPLYVTLKGRDLSGFGYYVGVWMGADAPDWEMATPAERLVSGFWCDANGYCLTTDTDSKNKSLWW